VFSLEAENEKTREKLESSKQYYRLTVPDRIPLNAVCRLDFFLKVFSMHVKQKSCVSRPPGWLSLQFKGSKRVRHLSVPCAGLLQDACFPRGRQGCRILDQAAYT
jgi:hypothetical protein